jgi:hypothetical protein
MKMQRITWVKKKKKGVKNKNEEEFLAHRIKKSKVKIQKSKLKS